MFFGMYNEDSWTKKHRQNAQQCKNKKLKLIYTKKNERSFPDFYIAQ